jgi:hypothetical protein
MFLRNCVVLLVVVGCLWGCADGLDGGMDGGNDSDSGSTRYSEISAALVALRAKLRTDLVSMSIPEAFQAAAELMRGFPVVANVEVRLPASGAPEVDTGFSVEFANGISYGLALFPVTREELNRILDRQKAGPPPDKPSIKPLSRGMPARKTARFLGMDNALATARYAALARSNGYSASSTSTATVDDFCDLQQFAILYVNGHGCYFKKKDIWYFGLLTDEKRNPDSDQKYIDNEDFQELRVRLKDRVYIVEDEDPLVCEDTEYAVTDQFIKYYSSAFGENSLVYIDACGSARRSSQSVLPPMTTAFSLHGANAYLGWTSLVCVFAQNKAAEFLWSYLLGEIPDTFSWVEKETPPIRPFGMVACMMALEDKGWNVDSYHEYGSTLEYMNQNLGTADLRLRPQIGDVSVTVDLEKKTHVLLIGGRFGEIRGTARLCPLLPTIGDATHCPTLNISDWSNHEIEVDLDENSTQDNGYVVVVVDGRASNPYPLTQWNATIKITGTQGNPGPDIELNIDARFLAEIVRERPRPNTDPMYMFGMGVGNFTLDSQLSWQFSGEFVEGQYRYKYPSDNRNSGKKKLGSDDGETGWTGSVKLSPWEGNASFQIITVLNAFYEKYNIGTGQLEEEKTIKMGISVSGDTVMNLDGEMRKDILTEAPLKAELKSITSKTNPSVHVPH